MLYLDPMYTCNMTDHQRARFYAEYERTHKDEVIGVLFAIFLGCFGVHHFYLRRNGLGILYLLIFWTGISAILGLIDAFFTPGRVRQYNAAQALYLASQIRATPSSAPPATHQCSACTGAIQQNAIFCPHCGTSTSGNTLAAQPAI